MEIQFSIGLVEILLLSAKVLKLLRYYNELGTKDISIAFSFIFHLMGIIIITLFFLLFLNQTSEFGIYVPKEFQQLLGKILLMPFMLLFLH